MEQNYGKLSIFYILTISKTNGDHTLQLREGGGLALSSIFSKANIKYDLSTNSGHSFLP